MPAYKIKVTLSHTKPTIDRTIAVPMDTTFEELAGIIVDAFGWPGGKPHSFIASDGNVTIENPVLSSVAAPGTVDERVAKLSDHAGGPIEFHYGEKGGWCHGIRFLKPLDDHHGEYPEVVKYRGACPPFDCGGVREYYESLGEDPGEHGWAGILVDADPADIEEANEYFANEWSRSEPVLDLRLTHDCMSRIADALLHPERESVLDTEVRDVLSVGDGEGEVDPAAADADTGRYIPVAPISPGFPQSAAKVFASFVGYPGELEVPAHFRLFESSLQGSGRDVYRRMMFLEAMAEAVRWAARNRITHESLPSATFSPKATMKSVMEANRMIEDAALTGDAEYLEGRTFVCPGCGNRCSAAVDRSLDPDRISGIAHYPAVMECPGCGTSTVLRMKNDGFNVGYAYPRFETPAELCEGAIRKTIAVDRAGSRPEELEALVDLGWEYALLNMVLETVGVQKRIPKVMGSRGWKAVPSSRFKGVALMMCYNNSSVDVRQEVRALKRVAGHGGGIWEAVFCAMACLRAESWGEAVRMHRLTMSILESCDPDDRFVFYARAVAVMGLFNADPEAGSAEAMDIPEKIIADLSDRAERTGFDTATMILLAKLYSGMMEVCCALGDLERGKGIASYMRGRFSRDEPVRGLQAVISYSEGLLHLVAEGGDRARGMECLREVHHLVRDRKDNGPYAIDRMLAGVPVLMHLGDGEALETRLLESVMGMDPDPGVLMEFLMYYIPAVARVIPKERTEANLAALGIALRPGVMDQLMMVPFDVAEAWRPRFVRTF